MGLDVIVSIMLVYMQLFPLASTMFGEVTIFFLNNFTPYIFFSFYRHLCLFVRNCEELLLGAQGTGRYAPEIFLKNFKIAANFDSRQLAPTKFQLAKCVASITAAIFLR